MRGVKRGASIFPKFKDEKNGMIGTIEQKHKLDHNLWMRFLILSINPDPLMK